MSRAVYLSSMVSARKALWAAALVLLIVISWLAVDGSDPSTAARPLTSGPQPSGLTLELRTTVDGHEVVFGEIGAVVADSAGRMYVADVQAQEIAVLDPEGDRVGTLGRSGEGPGEFTRLQSSLAWVGDTLLAALDARLQRLTLFDYEGSVAATRRWPVQVGTPFPVRHLLTGGGEAYLLEIARSPMRQLQTDRPPDPPEPPAFPPRYLRLESEGSTSLFDAGDGDLSGPLHAESATVTCMTPAGTEPGRVHFLTPPFLDRGPLRAFTPSGELVKAYSDSSRLDIVDPSSGEVRRTIEWDSQPIQLTDEDWEAVPEIQLLRGYEQEAGAPLEAMGEPGTPCALEAMRPDTHPVVRSVVTDEEGRFWVEQSAREGFTLAVLDTEGRMLGEAPMPARDPEVAYYVRDGHLYLVTVDALGVQGIQVYTARFDS